VTDDGREGRVELAHFRAAFLAEARELTALLESSVLALEQAPDDVETLNNAFRAAHSLKSAAAAAGRTHLAELTHALEAMMDALRARTLLPRAVHFGALYRAADVIARLIDGDAVDAVEAARQLVHEVEVFLPPAAFGGAKSGTDPELQPFPSGLVRLRIRLSEDSFAFGFDPLLALRELAELSDTLDVTLDDSRLPALAELLPERAYFGFLVEFQPKAGVTPAAVREAFAFADGSAELQFGAAPEPREVRVLDVPPMPAALVLPVSPDVRRSMEQQAQGATLPRAVAHEVSTIRVATDKIDKLIDVVGELVIAHSALRALTVDPAAPRAMALREAVLVADRHLRDLQQRVMAVRMIPVGVVFSRLPRTVRDVSARLGKEVAFSMEGAETELDKTLIEKLTDPLLHLVRNALDHGVELPAERKAQNKPRIASLTARAYARSGSVFVEVEDDGRGLDAPAIRAKAIERGIISESERLSEEKIFKLICTPGFSTKTEVTDVSGRGVGLDVVLKNIQSLNGDLQVISSPGRGTCFRLRLPLTLTIVDGLLIDSGQSQCVLPLTDVAFSVQLTALNVRSHLGSSFVLDLPGETLPLLDLGLLLGGQATPVRQQAMAVVVHSGQYRYALRVSRLLGQAQTVVKSIETHYRRIPGVMGATILGDGKVALILDGQGLALSAGLSRSRAAVDHHQSEDIGTCTVPS
jgi:two-component system chemotaxis sensor kinase CheA